MISILFLSVFILTTRVMRYCAGGSGRRGKERTVEKKNNFFLPVSGAGRPRYILFFFFHDFFVCCLPFINGGSPSFYKKCPPTIFFLKSVSFFYRCAQRAHTTASRVFELHCKKIKKTWRCLHRDMFLRQCP